MTFIEAGHEVEKAQWEPGIADSLQANRHDLDILLSQTTLNVSYGVHRRVSLDARIPFRVTKIEATFSRLDGSELPGFESIHHRDETLSGLADPVLGANYSVLNPGDWGPGSLSIRTGVSLPLGGTESDPFVLGKDGVTHQHMFFGTGTFVPVLGLTWNVPFSKWNLGGWTEVQLALYSNDKGYTPPTLYQGGIGAQTSFGLEDWWFRLEPQVMVETPAQWETGQAENSGRMAILGSGAFGCALGEGFGIGVDMIGTIASLTEGDQIDIPLVGSLTLSYGHRFTD